MFISLSKYLELEFLVCIINVYLHWSYCFAFLPATFENSSWFISSPVWVLVFNFTHSSMCKGSLMVLIFISLMNNDVLISYYSFLVEFQFVFCRFLKLCNWLHYWKVNILDIHSVSWSFVRHMHIFTPVACLFIFLIVSFEELKF